VDRKLVLEMERWELRGQGPSKLDEELAAAGRTLERHPYAGSRASRRINMYRLPLGRTQFVIFYRILENERVIEIARLMHGRHRRAGVSR
jgi:plasmid stabilization system protein ParE